MIILYIAIAVAAALYILFFLENRRFRSAFTVYENQRIHQEFRVVQISDLHDRSFGSRQSKLISAIRNAKPDFIVITGDLFNRRNHSACNHAFQLLHGITGIAPICFAEGNHECAMQEDGERYMSQIADMGVKVLRNTYANFPQCRIVGLKQMASKEEMIPLLSRDRFNLVLSHRPERIKEYAEAGVDVVLCGHAHGGQVRLGHLGMYAPQQGLFPKYTEGWHRYGNTNMYVSRGLGNTIAFPRVFNTPELNVIDFKPLHKEG